MGKSILIVFLCAFSSIWATKSGSPKDAILLVAFGTTSEPGTKAYTSIEKAVEKANPQRDIIWAYTSEIVRERIEKMSGKKIPSVTGALSQLKRNKYKKVFVQSLHVVAGQEYEQLNTEVRQFEASNPGTFDPIQIGRPLLDSKKDMDAVVTAVIKELSTKRKENEGVVLLGHGHHHGVADLPYVASASEFQKRDPLIVLGTVEGGVTLDGMAKTFKRAKVKKVWLAPFMVVAGVHTVEDLIGDEESVKADLEAAGFSCEGYVKGLGEYHEIASLFVSHLQQTIEAQ